MYVHYWYAEATWETGTTVGLGFFYSEAEAREYAAAFRDRVLRKHGEVVTVVVMTRRVQETY